VILLLVAALVVVVVLVGVVVLIRGVKLLPLRAISDEVSGVTALKAAPALFPPLLEKIVQGTELPCQ
jgi:hypothetical protein